MATEIHEPSIPKTEAGASMAGMVREAWLATSELDAEVERSTRESAFMLVLEAMLKDHISEVAPTESLTSGAEAGDGNGQPADDLYSTPELRTDAISSYLEIGEEQVEILFDVGGSEPTIHVGPVELSQAKRTATLEIALLMLSARTALGLDTQMDDIRKVVEQYRKYDRGNFAKTLQSSPDVVVLGKPHSSQRTVRLRGVGVSAARELAHRLVA